MSQLVQKTVTITNPQGLHARPAQMLSSLASQFESNIELVKNGEKIDAKSILSVLTLGAVAGTQIEIIAQGNDSKEALDALTQLVDAGFPDGETART